MTKVAYGIFLKKWVHVINYYLCEANNENIELISIHFFFEVKDKRPGNVKFVAGIILHVSKLIKDKNELKFFVETAISHLAPECLGPTFSTRLACQVI